MESKFYNNDTSPLYTGLDSVAQMIGNDPILERLDVPSVAGHRDETHSPEGYGASLQPGLKSGYKHGSTSSTRSPMLTKEEYISKIPTIESIESESNYEMCYIEEDQEERELLEEERFERRETNQSAKN